MRRYALYRVPVLVVIVITLLMDLFPVSDVMKMHSTAT